MASSTVWMLLLGRALGDYLGETWFTGVKQDNDAKQLRGSFTTVDVAGQKMPMYVSVPPGEHMDRRPAVIVAHHAVGIYNHAFLRQFADDLAELGFVAALPDLFHRAWNESIPSGVGIPVEKMNIMAAIGSLQDEHILQDVQAVLDALEQHAQVHNERIGILGFCMGGRIAWLAAVEARFEGRIHAAVSYHGGNVFKGLGHGGAVVQAPADRIKSNLKCSVLGHFGDVDKNPSPADMRRLQELAGEKLQVRLHPGADHGFSCKDSAKYADAAARDAWGETVAFLRRELGTPEVARPEL